jgi:hypothetical protein
MPLTPAVTDKFQKVGLPGTATTLSSPGYTVGNTSITVGSTTNWSTDTLVTFAIDQAQVTNGVESRIAGTYCEFEGIVTGANTIASLTLKYGSAQNYPAGALTRVYIPVSANQVNQLINGLRQDHNGKGNHQSLTDDNGNTWLGRIQIASAVNNVQVANAIAGKDPKISATGSDPNVNLQLDGKGTGVAVARNPELCFDHIVYGTGVWSGLGYGATLTATMTQATCYINGRRIVIAAIATRTFTASKDTYIDVLDNQDGTGTVVYTEVANNAASPALAANSVRMAIIVSGATNIATAGSVNQGQETITLPVISSIALSVTDSLGNLICPRDPNRKVLSYKQITSFSTSSNTSVQVTGLSCPVIVPSGRKVKITIKSPITQQSVNAAGTTLSAWEGTVGSGTLLNFSKNDTDAASYQNDVEVVAIKTPATTNPTYNAGYLTGGGTGSLLSGFNSLSGVISMTVELV